MSTSESRRRPDAILSSLPEQIQLAVSAASAKKASDIVVLDLRGTAAFTDFFVLCSGQNVRQVKAIVDALEEQFRLAGTKPAYIEGVDTSEWVLLDFFDFVIHVFTPQMRVFYSLERLWGSAERIDIEDETA